MHDGFNPSDETVRPHVGHSSGSSRAFATAHKRSSSRTSRASLHRPDDDPDEAVRDDYAPGAVAQDRSSLRRGSCLGSIRETEPGPACPGVWLVTQTLPSPNPYPVRPGTAPECAPPPGSSAGRSSTRRCAGTRRSTQRRRLPPRGAGGRPRPGSAAVTRAVRGSMRTTTSLIASLTQTEPSPTARPETCTNLCRPGAAIPPALWVEPGRRGRCRCSRPRRPRARRRRTCRRCPTPARCGVCLRSSVSTSYRSIVPPPGGFRAVVAPARSRST